MRVPTSRAAASPAIAGATSSQTRPPNTDVAAIANGAFAGKSSSIASASARSRAIRKSTTRTTRKKSQGQTRRAW